MTHRTDPHAPRPAPAGDETAWVRYGDNDPEFEAQIIPGAAFGDDWHDYVPVPSRQAKPPDPVLAGVASRIPAGDGGGAGAVSIEARVPGLGVNVGGRGSSLPPPPLPPTPPAGGGRSWRGGLFVRLDGRPRISGWLLSLLVVAASVGLGLLGWELHIRDDGTGNLTMMARPQQPAAADPPASEPEPDTPPAEEPARPEAPPLADNVLVGAFDLYIDRPRRRILIGREADAADRDRAAQMRITLSLQTDSDWTVLAPWDRPDPVEVADTGADEQDPTDTGEQLPATIATGEFDFWPDMRHHVLWIGRHAEPHHIVEARQFVAMREATHNEVDWRIARAPGAPPVGEPVAADPSPGTGPSEAELAALRGCLALLVDWSSEERGSVRWLLDGPQRQRLDRAIRNVATARD